MRAARILLIGAGLLAASACQSPADRPGSTVPGACQVEVPLVAPAKTDILFVIDESGSMSEEQDAIASELPAFVDELQRGAGVEVDFRVGVTTTSVYVYAPGVLDPPLQTTYPTGPPRNGAPYAAGRLQPVPSTGERFLDSTDPNLVSKFAALIRQGTLGSGQETPFEAARLALSPPLSTTPLEEGGNGGFLRDGARLLIVVVTDEDDCSETARPPRVSIGTSSAINYCRDQETNLTPTSEYFEIFRNLTQSNGRLRDVAWAAIAPVAMSDKRAEQILDDADPGSPPPPVVRNADCPTSQGPGFRQREMAELFDPALQNLDSICNASFRDSLIRIAGLASVNQVVDVSGVPDEALLKVELTRADGTVQACTVANEGIRYQAPADEETPGQVLFQGSCLRRSDDRAVAVKLLCAG